MNVPNDNEERLDKDACVGCETYASGGLCDDCRKNLAERARKEDEK